MTDVDFDPETAMPLTAERFRQLGWSFVHSDPGYEGDELDADQLRVGREVRRNRRDPLFVIEKRGRGDVRVEQRASSIEDLFAAVHEYEGHQR